MSALETLIALYSSVIATAEASGLFETRSVCEGVQSDKSSMAAFEEVRPSSNAVLQPMAWPSADPELMIRMLIVGNCFGIRSERRLASMGLQNQTQQHLSTRDSAKLCGFFAF
nr:transposase [Trinickia violacea]